MLIISSLLLTVEVIRSLIYKRFAALVMIRKLKKIAIVKNNRRLRKKNESKPAVFLVDQVFLADLNQRDAKKTQIPLLLILTFGVLLQRKRNRRNQKGLSI